MAQVTDPILLDSTGQEIVEALETIAENMGTSAGHTIQNDSGTDMQRRDKLQFKGVYVDDDQTNNKTVVNVIRQMTLAEFNQLTTEQKKGLINVTDQQGHPITASDIPYDSNNTVKDKIDDIEEELHAEITISGNGVDNYSTLFDTLNALIDSTKINPKSVFIMNDGLRDYIYQPHFLRNSTNLYIFSRTSIGATDIDVSQTRIGTSGSTLTGCTGGVITDQSATVPSADYKFTIRY